MQSGGGVYSGATAAGDAGRRRRFREAPLTAPSLTFGSVSTRLLVVLLLVLANAFFVAAEFALVAARRSRIAQWAAAGDRRARVVEQALGQLDRYISGTQLGITLASLALGWVGEPALAALVDVALRALGFDVPSGLVHSGAAIATAFAIITFLHIVLGELAPKALALSRPEEVSKWVAWPLMQFSRLMHPGIVVLNGTANALLRAAGIAPASEASHVHSPEELRLLVLQARAQGTLDESDTAMLEGVFDFRRKKVRDVMRPRTEVAGIPDDASEADVRAILARERYSRYPVYRETLDDIAGVLVAKDVWLRDAGSAFDLAALTREVLFVPDVRSAERVFDDLRRTRAQLAVVLDEYGGTAGIVTIEDLVEEVVGDIADEYDQLARESMIQDGVLELAGSLSLVDVRSDHKVAVPEGDWTTLGGYVFSALGRLPQVGDRTLVPGADLEVVAMDGRRVAAVRVHQVKA
ncbi:MAG: hemolysin family protein [Gemmatimonadota bacterium]